jgi:hypothetical protein
MKDIPSEIETQPDSNLMAFGQPVVGQSTIKESGFLPDIWDAAGAFISPELEIRCEGFRRLDEADAARNYALAAYLFFTRLTEPDIELRTRIVAALSNVFIPTDGYALEKSPAFLTLTHELSGMRTRQVFALLQVVDFDKSADYQVAALLEYCSYAGDHLAGILANRSLPLSIRKQAAYFIGQLGYMDALPVLERMSTRLTQRRIGRDDYGDAVDPGDECSLLPLLQDALAVLTAP